MLIPLGGESGIGGNDFFKVPIVVAATVRRLSLPLLSLNLFPESKRFYSIYFFKYRYFYNTVN